MATIVIFSSRLDEYDLHRILRAAPAAPATPTTAKTRAAPAASSDPAAAAAIAAATPAAAGITRRDITTRTDGNSTEKRRELTKIHENTQRAPCLKKMAGKIFSEEKSMKHETNYR
uniref:Uncharacterized protein n=1 Tax=Pristionchus pacificus TaxID=54126 RepID=A0A2A6C8I3_PRIPA|eukprot:PDM74494.1 hypothetical protein PRIPAC_41850 [Pristionchus pacificus]